MNRKRSLNGVTQRAVTALSHNISCELQGCDASGRTGLAPGILSGRQLCQPYTYTGQLHSQLSFGVNHTAGDAVNRPMWGNLIPGSLLILVQALSLVQIIKGNN